MSCLPPEEGASHAENQPLPYRTNQRRARRLQASARRYTLPYRDVVRAKIVLMAAEGLDNDEIAVRLDTPPGDRLASGASGSSSKDCPGSRSSPEEAGPQSFPPEVVVAVKALACELPALGGAVVAVARADIGTEVASTRDRRRDLRDHDLALAVRPTPSGRGVSLVDLPPRPGLRAQGRPRARPVRRPRGRASRWANGTTSSPPTRRPASRPGSAPPHRSPGSTRATMRVEHEYDRGGALAYLAAWDVHRAKLFGRCEPTTGIEPFGRLVEQVMTTSPTPRPAGCSGSSTTASSTGGALGRPHATALGPTSFSCISPVHASWLNQIEIYFSIVQRKVLTPNDFADLAEVEARLLGFQDHYERTARPFEWSFTRADLDAVLAKIQGQHPSMAEAA